ncbi:MAG: hypothetical protein IKF99_07265 [Oscillospiraceae bacterium]|nr:hypothetical protein [Oscillospiraceae bacterium]
MARKFSLRASSGSVASSEPVISCSMPSIASSRYSSVTCSATCSNASMMELTSGRL